MRRAAGYFKLDELDLVKRARANLESARDPDTNAFDKTALIAEVERLMSFDPVRERHRKAERIVRDQERPRKTEADGSLWLPGFEPYVYEPNRLIPDDTGKTVEQDKATAHFVGASLARKAEHLERAQNALRRARAEADLFAEWAADAAMAGRPANEICLGIFFRESGYWQSNLVDDEDGVDED